MAAKKPLFRSLDLRSGPQVLTIESIVPVGLKAGNSTIAFRETPKCISLTRRRANLLVELFGENIKSAVGKQVELFRGHGMYKGIVTAFVDVRSPKK